MYFTDMMPIMINYIHYFRSGDAIDIYYKDMSRGDICRSLGLDRAYISNVENGKQNLTLSTMEKVAKVLEVSVNRLLR